MRDDKLNLMVHCGAQFASLIDVAAVKTPKPTDTWKPLPHADFIKMVKGVLRDLGHDIVAQAHALQGDYGERYFGMVQTRHVDYADDEFGHVVGLRNAHDKRMPAALVGGSGVFVCDNLCFSGEVKIGRKHTAHILRDLPEMIEAALSKLERVRAVHRARIDHYRGVDLGSMEVNDLVVQAMQREVITVTKIPNVLGEWDEPENDAWREEPRTAWRLHNAFTEVQKGNSLFQRPRVTQGLNALLDEATLFDPEEIAA